MGERVPQHVQNLVIRDYCEKNKLDFLLSATEYAMPKSHFILEEILDEQIEIDGLVAYSIFQLPEEAYYRAKIYNKVLIQKKSFHFAVEGLCASTNTDFERIESLWRVRLTMPQCLQNF